MKKTLLVLCGAVVCCWPHLHFTPKGGRDYYGGHGGPRIAARGYPSGGRYWHGHYGHYYYLGGVPYFFPFDDPFYSGYYFGAPYGYGAAGGNPYYEGQINQDNNGPAASKSAASLPEAVQKQLAKRGYYKGEIDGDFGTASKSALNKFQRDNDLKPTGRIDADTLKALGFDEHGDRD